MRRRWIMAVTVALSGLAAVCRAEEPVPSVKHSEAPRTGVVLKKAFPRAPADWSARLKPDATMTTCAAYRNHPPKAVAEAIAARERARIRYPDDGRLIGDWRNGERIAQSGYGMRFTDIDKTRANGGNCYACHRITNAEVSYGTLGASLVNYGRLKDDKEAAARAVYDKIYNSHAAVPCSLMPRFGANGILTIEQIKDLVALLMDPESPVNK